MKRLLTLLVCICMFFSALPISTYAAPSWPDDVGVESGAGIVIDADTGAVLFGQNIHVAYYPASITKVLTALVVLDNCSDLNETVTFSHNAVYNVESGSTSAGYDTGDTATVKDCLYALLLKSANEVANALAEHVGGSIEGFADMMNAKAEELGCSESHFSNPSGLNDENHYTTAYDYALISKAAFSNPAFVEIDSTTYYELPPNSQNPEGQTVYCGHQMLKKNSSRYYPGIIGGKTGYTILAGNTLVTCAEKNGLRLISVVLNAKTPGHYTDTKALLDFGFNNFTSVKISDFDTTYLDISDDMTIAGLPATTASALTADRSKTITLPVNASYDDVTSELTYELDKTDPSNAAAKIQYYYNDRKVGCTYLLIDETRVNIESGSSAGPGETVAPEGNADAGTDIGTGTDTDSVAETPNLYIPIAIILGLIVVLFVIIIIVLHSRKKKAYDDSMRIARLEQRLQRLNGDGYSSETINNVLRDHKAINDLNKVSLRDRIFKKKRRF